jgi:hypothetical protein
MNLLQHFPVGVTSIAFVFFHLHGYTIGGNGRERKKSLWNTIWKRVGSEERSLHGLSLGRGTQRKAAKLSLP